MTKLLIDTCIWLDIAKTTKSDEILNLLDEFIKEKQLTLIVPRIIIDEFTRNKERVVSDAGKSLTSHINKVKDVIRVHAGEEQKEAIIKQLDNLDYKLLTAADLPFNTARRVEKLLSEAEIIEINNDMKLRAAQRAIDKKAPFHLSKNSMGDALIIEAYSEYKQMNESQELKFMFVTHNKNDFSVQDGNQKNPHEDIAHLFDSLNSFYFISLPDALDEINPAIVEHADFLADWHFVPRTFTEILAIERELDEKIWYNRHQILAYKIKEGEVKIVKREKYTAEDVSHTIVKDIWEGAKAAAKKIEKKYGKKNLQWDDFEWGMINGKLSAIRWALGEDWDSLYT